jgi:hypothetical protein
MKLPGCWKNWLLILLLVASVLSLPAQTTSSPLVSDTNSPALSEASGGAPTNSPGLLLTNSAAPPKSDAPVSLAAHLAAVNASNLLAQAATNTAIVVPTTVVGRPVPAYTNFTLVNDRNIFNPNRRPGRPPREFTNAPQPQIESFWLTGILSSDKGTFAFFDGSGYLYRKALKEEGAIGGYKVASIEPPDKVELETGGKRIELPMGMQMRRRDGGPWEKTEMSPESASSDTSSFNGSLGRTHGSDRTAVAGSEALPVSQFFPRSPPPGGDAASGGGGGDALQRLLRKRELELNTDKPK